MSTIVIEGGTVADADGTVVADVAVDTEAGEILAVGDVSGAVEAATTVTRLDATGQFVAPGLVDAHVHLQMDGRPDTQSGRHEPRDSYAYTAASNLRTAVENGVTTVRDLGATGEVAIQAREAVADGRLVGPRVCACGRTVVVTGGHTHWSGREADGPAEVRKAAREQLKRGADVVKCMATGGVLTEGAKTEATELTPAELEALVDAASAKGVPTAAHAHGKAGIVNAAEAGITSVEHGTYMDREAAATMAEHDTYWVPTASALRGIVDNADAEGGIPADAVEKAERAAEVFATSFEHAAAEGVEIAMGTDAGTPFNHVSEIPTELQYMVEYGMEPAAALEAATVTAAELCGVGDVGLIEAGYAADLVVLPANPREDPAAYEELSAVIADGQQVV
ncbi:amidohydrolase family protein [Halobaculum sp. MBLA0143]|uniref:metal-dependent hydrolase family protein n=1 Tax=Halobaculum sp. MBLA0143 TaxID=3079933 RepID=UPI003523D10C